MASKGKHGCVEILWVCRKVFRCVSPFRLWGREGGICLVMVSQSIVVIREMEFEHKSISDTRCYDRLIIICI